MSARCSSVSASSPWVGKVTMPMLESIVATKLGSRSGLRSVASVRSAISRAASVLGAGQQDHELVAADACERVGRPEQRLEARADRLQQQIAGRVAERVVDLLEAVEVDHHQRERLGSRAAPRQLLEAVEQEPAVRKARELIVEGVVLALRACPRSRRLIRTSMTREEGKQREADHDRERRPDDHVPLGRSKRVELASAARRAPWLPARPRLDRGERRISCSRRSRRRAVSGARRRPRTAPSSRTGSGSAGRGACGRGDVRRRRRVLDPASAATKGSAAAA